MSFIAQFSKFCAKVIHFLHIRKKNVQYFAEEAKKNMNKEKSTSGNENKSNFILLFVWILVTLQPISKK